MKILLASSEAHPYSKTGGLADMIGALARTLARLGHQVGLVTPLYSGIRERFPQLKRLDLALDFPLGAHRVQAEVWSLEPGDSLTIYFIEQAAFYQRSELYQIQGADYADNAERFIFFSKAVAHLAMHLPWKPEVVHLNDWQSGLAALFLEHERRLSGRNAASRTCLTIHNLAYQGVFPGAQYALTNLPSDYFTPGGVEFYGHLNCLKAGIAYADVLTTVSPRYAREIMTREFGCGLDGLLRDRQRSLLGILNGVDYTEWNTINNPFLGHPYSSGDFDGKQADKLELQKEFGLPANAEVPLFGSIGRLVEQKGVDIMLGALEEMLSADLQTIVLGSGASMFQKAFQQLAARFPSRLAVHIGWDQGLSHRIEAGSDFFLMPSRFEPCGLNQMYSLRYATVPIVRITGGLDDTVVDITEDPALANGIKFGPYSASALARSIRKALSLFQEPRLLSHFRRNAMAADFSWDRTASKYLEAYESVTR